MILLDGIFSAQYLKYINYKIIVIMIRVITITIGLTTVKRLFKPFLFLADTLQVSAPSAFHFLEVTLVKDHSDPCRKNSFRLTSREH